MASLEGALWTTFLAPGGDVLLAGLFGQEKAGALDDQIGADLVPLQVGRIALGGQADPLAVDDHGVAVDGDVALEVTVHRVVLQHVGQVVRVQQVIDADDFDTREILRNSAESHTTDTAKPIDANFDSHPIAPVERKNQPREAGQRGSAGD